MYLAGVPKTEEEEIPTKRFCYVTNLTPKACSPCPDLVVARIAECGRRRWKIENEGFNCQKHRGYNLHKFKRGSVDTLHNYYTLLQMAHLINQVVIHSLEVAALLGVNPS